MSDEVRPFFGETPEAIGENQQILVTVEEEAHTPAVWRELKIADGFCPMIGCGGVLDVDFFCSLCGNVSLPKLKDET